MLKGSHMICPQFVFFSEAGVWMFEQSSARDGGSNTCPCPYACDAHSSTQRVRDIAILCWFVGLFVCNVFENLCGGRGVVVGSMRIAY